jgi:hypothetical protein
MLNDTLALPTIAYFSTDYLYGGDERYRLCQGVVLGIGGVWLLRALGYTRGGTSYRCGRCASPPILVCCSRGAPTWQGDAPLQRPFAHAVIYEMPVAGFTRHPSSGVVPAKRGTYAGLIEKIPYLVQMVGALTKVDMTPQRKLLAASKREYTACLCLSPQRSARGLVTLSLATAEP